MGFGDAIKVCLQQKYADFSGRALRSEFWYFMLGAFLLQLAAIVVLSFSDTLASIVSLVIALGLMVPSLAASARRLHDTDKSGWWQLLLFIPLIGIIVLIVFLAQQGSLGANRYGAPAG